MSAVPSADHAYLGIGEVLGQLRANFPDVTISKIRFLESHGLVSPERTPSGYRKFTRADVDRLRYVLTAQREDYLPLKVIKEHLEALDRGLEVSDAGGRPRIPAAKEVDRLGQEAFHPDVSEIRLSRDELLQATGLADATLTELEQYGLLAPLPGAQHFDGESLLIARTVADLATFGIGARHLRAFKLAADREVGLLEQVVTPLLRSRRAESRERADEVVAHFLALSVRLHTALVRSALRASRPR